MNKSIFRWTAAGLGILALSVALHAQTSLMRLLPGTSSTPAISDTVNGNAGFYFGNGFVGQIGHEAFSGTAPTLSACGTGPTISGTDTGGIITTGTTATGCTVTFATPYNATPNCSVSWQSNLTSMAYTVSTTAITITQTSASNNKLNYSCQGQSGG